MRIFIHNVDTFLGQVLVKELRPAEGGMNRIFGTALNAENAPPEVKRLLSRDDPKRAEKMTKTIQSCRLIIMDLFSCKMEDLQFALQSLKVTPGSDPEQAADAIFILISSCEVWNGTAAALRKALANAQVAASLESAEDTEGRPGTAGEATEETAGAEADTADTTAEAPAGEDDAAVTDGVEQETAGEAGAMAGAGTEEGSLMIKSSDYKQRKPVEASRFEEWLEMEDLVFKCFNKEEAAPKGFVVAGGALYGDGEETFSKLFENAWRRGTRNDIPDNAIVSPGTNRIPMVHVRDLSRLVRQIGKMANDGEFTPENDPYFIAVDQPPGADEQKPLPSMQADIIRAVFGEISEDFEIPMLQDAPLTTDAEAEPDALTQAMSLDLRLEPSALMLAENFAELWHCKDGMVANIRKISEEFCKKRKLKAMRIVISGPPASGKTILAAAVADHFTVPHIELDSRSDEELVKMLSSKVCRYRGYVLDAGCAGFERVKNLFSVFTSQKEATPGEGEEEEAAPEGEDGEEQKTPSITRVNNDEIIPEFVIVLQAPEGLCKARWRAANKGSTEEFDEKMNEYTKLNLTDESTAFGFSDFFLDMAKIGVFNLPVAMKDEDDLFESCRIYVESKGRPYNYLPTEDQVTDKILAARSEKKSAEMEMAAQKTQSAYAAGEQGKARQEQNRLKVVAEHEMQVEALRSLPLREYLVRYMVPTLTEGLIEVCKVVPDNPVDYLASYLEEHAADEVTTEVEN